MDYIWTFRAEEPDKVKKNMRIVYDVYIPSEARYSDGPNARLGQFFRQDIALERVGTVGDSGLESVFWQVCGQVKNIFLSPAPATFGNDE